MLDLRRLALAALLFSPGCIVFERGEGTSATSAGDPGDDPTTGAGQPVITCDPLLQDCAEGEACALIDRLFACITVHIDGGYGDPCLTAGECGPGLACCPGPLVPGCDDAKCCVPLCDVGDGAAGCPEGTACAPVFTGPDLPAEVQDYGVCKLAD